MSNINAVRFILLLIIILINLFLIYQFSIHILSIICIIKYPLFILLMKDLTL